LIDAMAHGRRAGLSCLVASNGGGHGYGSRRRAVMKSGGFFIFLAYFLTAGEWTGGFVSLSHQPLDLPQ